MVTATKEPSTDQNNLKSAELASKPDISGDSGSPKPQVMMHENLTSFDEVKMPSERSFGFTFAVVFMLLAFFPMTKGEPIHENLMMASGAMLLITLTIPQILKPLNFVWYKFGLLLHKIVSPIILGIIFYLVVTPVGIVMRLMGKDLLRLERSKEQKSYWIERQPIGPPPKSMANPY